MKTISTTETQARPSAATLIHVLPEEHFAQQHLPGAVNACVYEMIFLAKVAELVPDKSAPVIVYGAGGESLDAVTAAEKLMKAGYADVSVFSGGIVEWRQTGLPLDGSASPPDSSTPNGVYEIDTETSVVRWTGRNLFNHHQGTVKLTGGRIEVQNGVLLAARFTLDNEQHRL